MTEMVDGCVIDGYIADEPNDSFPKLEKIGDVKRLRSVDLRPYCSPVEDQKAVGSCVANAVVGALEFHQISQGSPLRDLSRLFVYYNARKLRNRIGQSGCLSADALACVLAYGVCPASMWPYQHAMVDVEPTRDCFVSAERFRTVEFAELGGVEAIKDALASGLPVVFGMPLPPEAFREVARSGHLHAPVDGKWEQARGGHAMLMVGYDDDIGAFLVRNSWGTGWGKRGYFWLDYQAYAHYGRYRTFVVGAIADKRAYKITGTTPQQVLQAVAARSGVNFPVDMAETRQSAASELEDNLNKTRQSIRDRLRGPGAGGGC